jgi:hypothetical protein
VSRSQTDIAHPDPGALTPASLWKPLAEWLLWIVLALVVYSQTGAFDQEIAEYAFGAAGWPRALCIAVVVGATGQLGYRILSIRRGGETEVADEVGADIDDAERPIRLKGWRLVQRLGIFVFPLLYLYVTPSLGFYVTTPVFILGLLLLLEVKSPIAIATVTVVVYGLVLLIFTRLFYVALPVGRIEAFYDVNNAIIGIARYGL